MKKTLIFLMAMGTMIQMYSQNEDIAYPHVIPMTPNAAEIAKYADYPVSYYTGIPNISIPIYEIDVDGVQIPISLNYHASGIRVDQEATWVGLGWALNVGNRISRTVKSADDFKIGGFDRNFPHILAGYYDAPDMDSGYFNHYGQLGSSSCHETGCWEYNLLYDPEPDIFFYNLPGMNGKFLLDKSRGAVLFDKSHNIKIEIIRGSSTVSFKLTDKDGNQYFYNNWEVTDNYSSNGWLNKNIHNNLTTYDSDTFDFPNWTSIREDEDFVNNNLPNSMVTSWVLSKIITKNRKEINFSYSQEDQYLPTQESLEKYNYNGDNGFFYQKSKIVNKGLRLNSIQGDFGRVQFSSGNRFDIKGTSEKLNAISIYNNLNELIKTFKFEYSYFNDDYSGNYQYEHVFKRLKLNSLREYSSTNSPLNNGYEFNYYSGEFPPKNSKNVDYWGFQNGRDYGQNYVVGVRLINNQEVFSGFKKDFNFDKAIIGTLKSIKYPTGGTAEFEFESNTISSGGFLEANTHEWLPPTSTSNNLLSLNVFNYYNSVDYHLYSDFPSQKMINFEIEEQTIVKVNAQLENTMQVRDMTYNYESYSTPLGELRRIDPSTNTYYTYLCPLLWDATPSQSLGQGSEANLMERQFTLQPGTYQFEAYMPPRDVLVSWRLSFDRPLPSGGTGINPVTGPYSAGGIRIKEIITDAKKRKFKYPVGTLLKMPVLYYYGQRIGLPYTWATLPLVQVSESASPLTTFNGGNAIGYDWVVEESGFDINGNNSKTKYSYFNDTESDQFDDQYPDSPYYLNYTNGLLKSIEKFKTENQVDVSLVEKNEFYYTTTYSNIIKAFKDKGPGQPMGTSPRPSQGRSILEYFYHIEWPLQTKSVEILITDDNNSVVKEKNYSYNSRDLLQSTSYELDNSLITEKIYYPIDFTNDSVSQSMVSKNMIGIPVETIILKDNKLIQATKTQFNNFSGLYLPKSIKKTNLTTTNVSEQDRDSYYQTYLNFNEYDYNGNLIEVSKPQGIHIVYLWDYKKQHPLAKIENATYSEVEGLLGTGFSPGVGGLSSSQEALLRSNLSNAQVTTYTYKPLIGITSITDPKGDTVTYHYDPFNRLEFIRDKEGNILNEYKYKYISSQ